MIGSELGHYRIEAKLGEGGMGVVYKARDTHLDRWVAIKVLSSEALADPERKRRFVQEARTASALNHPNIIHIYDIDQSHGIEFMAMEFVQGKTLHQYVGAQGRPPGEVLQLAIQVAGALARSHEAGIVHRDIKPANIMVTPEGIVKVLDFGLAKLTEPAPGIGDAGESDATRTVPFRTEEGIVFGTVEYMSPEQAEGKRIDARSDIFSFGTVLYEMIAGRRPFQGNSKLAILSAILCQEPVHLMESLPGTPAALDQIVRRCLEKDPERRFQKMSEVKTALEELQDASRIASTGGRLGSPPVPSELSSSRRRWLVWGAAGILAITLLIAAPFTWRMWRSGHRQHLVAVLPFQSVAADADGQAFSEGLVETLSRKLYWLDQFQQSERVLPPGDVQGDASLGPAEAHKKLGADLILTGTVQRTGQKMHCILRLLDAASSKETKRLEFDLPLQEAARMQQELLHSAVMLAGLTVPSRANEVLAAGTTSIPDAYDSYLRAHGYLKHADRPADLARAITLFQEALAQDPSFGRAYAGLGEAYWARGSQTQDQQWAEKARDSCLRAIAAKADLAEVHLTLGRIYSGTSRSQEAIAEFRKALQFNPMSIDAHTSLGEAYEASGQLADSEGTYRALIQLWPDYLVPYSHLGSFYVRQGRYQDAEPVFRRFIELAPENASGYQNLGAVYHLLGRNEDAAAMMKKSLSIKPTARGFTNLGTLYFFQGRYSDAVPLMEKATEMEPENYVYWGNLGDAYRWAPESKERAPEAYRHAIKLGEQVLTMNADNANLRAALAGYYAKLPDKAKALAEIAWARRLAPVNPQVLFKAALVYEITGRREQALGALDLALQSGYSMEEAITEPELAELRKDPRFAGLNKEHKPVH